MLKKLAYFILKYRLSLLFTLVAVTVVMGYFGSKVQITFNNPRLLPSTDTASIDYDFFKEKFGQDGTILVIGIKKDELNTLNNFQAWAKAGDDLKNLAGIKNVLSVARLNDIILNDSLGKFEFKPLKGSNPTTQGELEDLWLKINSLKFYEGYVFDRKTNCTSMLVTFYEKDLNTKNRLDIVDNIRAVVDSFSKATNIEVHYSGLPYIRTIIMRKISHEMIFFLLIALLVTALILIVFFRSMPPMIFSLIVVVMGVITSLGTTVLFGYKLTVLSGLIPPLIIVIGVPNCILILNKYHTEIARGISKMAALHIAIQRSTVSLFFANITTSIGFAVFCATKNQILFEFGLVASISVMATFAFSLILIPIIFSYLPIPNKRQLKHLDGKGLRKSLDKIATITVNNRKAIYITVTTLVVVCFIGALKIRAFGFVVDDIPKTDVLITDLKYFEEKFGGVLPFEITIDTKKENGIIKNSGRALYRINRVQKLLAHYPELSRPISLVEVVKFLNQSYKGGEEKDYRMPSVTDLKILADYIKEEKEKQSQIRPFVDSTKRYTRISVQMKDAGSVRVKELTKELKPRIDSIFNYDDEAKQWLPKEEQYDIRITGNSIMFLKGNDFLINNLIESVVLAIVLIALLMLTLFTSFRMILISTIPSLVALLITAGVMGYLGIPLKPSTILVFSIAFGISSDGTLYFLTKYRYEIKKNKRSISDAVKLTISETGVSMIYTAIVLFFGFGMFALSGFGGTQALGILISFTLIVAYCANLVLLPAFLLSLEKRLTGKDFIESKSELGEALEDAEFEDDKKFE
ncbi:MAG: MMPL family transporter [Bacteroidia bacterium]|nr:MMPL family transporter [Bacteroidia bacterium]